MVWIMLCKGESFYQILSFNRLLPKIGTAFNINSRAPRKMTFLLASDVHEKMPSGKWQL